MQPERSIHDNHVYGYSVDCEGRQLTLHTAFTDCDPVEYTDVIFRDVFAHRFEHVLAGNILFDVQEIELTALVQDNAELLAESWRYGWPPFDYGGDLAKLVSSMRAASARAFAVNSSYGLSGWVVARSSERAARGSPVRIT
jgi:hypothetical protein